MVSESPLHVEKNEVCLAFSPGGHFAELERAICGVEFEHAFAITFASAKSYDPELKVYTVTHPRRSVLRTIRAFVETWLILSRRRPSWVISTGADVALPALIIGKLLGARLIFVETGGTLEPSITGRIVYPLADLFIVCWPEKRRAFPRAILADSPLW